MHGLTELWVKTGVGDSNRIAALHELAASLSRDIREVLPAIHSLTGCNYNSKVGSKKQLLSAALLTTSIALGTLRMGCHWKDR